VELFKLNDKLDMFGVDSGVEEEDAEGAMGERTEWFEFN
jgi:hypothetical protein